CGAFPCDPGAGPSHSRTVLSGRRSSAEVVVAPGPDGGASFAWTPLENGKATKTTVSVTAPANCLIGRRSAPRRYPKTSVTVWVTGSRQVLDFEEPRLLASTEG